MIIFYIFICFIDFHDWHKYSKSQSMMIKFDEIQLIWYMEELVNLKIAHNFKIWKSLSVVVSKFFNP